MSGDIVAIVGRPNVGKSTLFNRLVGMRQAITDATEGTTRDRHYGTTDWRGREFTVIDTGGYTVGSDDVFEQAICRQVALAIEEADQLIFMVDVETGVTDLDDAMANILRRQQKPVHVVVNKVDNVQRQGDSYVFFGLGLGDPITVSSISGSGTGELLDAVVAALPPVLEKAEDIDIQAEIENEAENEPLPAVLPRIAIVGRPNVGKSSLINALLDQERNIVTPVAGTTRDAILTRYNKFGMEFDLIDTAGLRKKQKVTEDLEFYSVMRTIRAIESCDTAILMLDAAQGVDAQDMNIFHLMVKNRKGCVIVVNKWDTIPDKETNTVRDYAEQIRSKLAPFNDVPILFTSVTQRQRIFDVLKKALEVTANRRRRIPTSELNEFILPIIQQPPPPAIKGKYIRIKYAMMLPTPTPQFAFFVNLPQYIKDPYRRFLENRIRARWDFEGVPMQIYFRQK